jgi:hypothetical protein
MERVQRRIHGYGNDWLYSNPENEELYRELARLREQLPPLPQQTEGLKNAPPANLFTGGASLGDVLDGKFPNDIDFGPLARFGSDYVKSHGGLTDAMTGMRKAVLRYLQKYALKADGSLKPVFLTGHSSGGTLMNIFRAYLGQVVRKDMFLTYTYGAAPEEAPKRLIRAPLAFRHLHDKDRLAQTIRFFKDLRLSSIVKEALKDTLKGSVVLPPRTWSDVIGKALFAAGKIVLVLFCGDDSYALRYKGLDFFYHNRGPGVWMSSRFPLICGLADYPDEITALLETLFQTITPAKLNDSRHLCQTYILLACNEMLSAAEVVAEEGNPGSRPAASVRKSNSSAFQTELSNYAKEALEFKEFVLREGMKKGLTSQLRLNVYAGELQDIHDAAITDRNALINVIGESLNTGFWVDNKPTLLPSGNLKRQI